MKLKEGAELFPLKILSYLFQYELFIMMSLNIM